MTLQSIEPAGQQYRTGSKRDLNEVKEKNTSKGSKKLAVGAKK